MNDNKQQILFKNGRIITAQGIKEGFNLLYANNSIKLIERENLSGFRRIIDLKGNLLSPGLTELHIHGCGQWGFENIDLDGFRLAADFLLNRGITAIVPTFQWDKRVVANASKIIRAYRKEDGRIGIPGIYIEGPFINPAKKGGISDQAIALPSKKLLAEIIEAGDGLIRIMTLAPELAGISEIAQLLIYNRIIPAFGHSNCGLHEAELLYDFCISRNSKPGMTHICNASSGLSHREPGLAMLPFTRDTYFELNADGVHIAEPMLKLFQQGTPAGRMLLISDALISAGLDPDYSHKKIYYYGKEVVPTKQGVRSKDSDILSGSAVLIPDVIRHFTEATGTALNEAITAVTDNTCRFLGLSGGTIIPGAKTDLAVFNEKMELQELFTCSKI